MWSDVLTTTEAGYTRRVLSELKSSQWVRPLLAKIEAAGGLHSRNKPLLFEARYAYELHRRGVVAEYETCSCALGAYGPAPNFQRALRAGLIKMKDTT